MSELYTERTPRGVLRRLPVSRRRGVSVQPTQTEEGARAVDLGQEHLYLFVGVVVIASHVSVSGERPKLRAEEEFVEMLVADSIDGARQSFDRFGVESSDDHVTVHQTQPTVDELAEFVALRGPKLP